MQRRGRIEADTGERGDLLDDRLDPGCRQRARAPW